MSDKFRRVNQRPRRLPRWRFAFVGMTALALSPAGTAAADQTAVMATIYSPHRVSDQGLSASALDKCPPYSGANPMVMYPGGLDFQVPAPAWSLSTVVSCGFGEPLGGISAVQVQRSTGAFEAPLSAQDLALPSPFQDPQAEPVIAIGSPNYYVRPWRGGVDQNAGDMVTTSGPIVILIYANGEPLRVVAYQRRLPRRSRVTVVGLRATVSDPNGAPLPPGGLTWSWSFGDGASASAASPVHAFADGSWSVTVQVSDPSTGQGGTATIVVNANAGRASGTTPRTGGSRRSRSKAPTGPVTGGGNRSGGSPASRSAGTGGSHTPSADTSSRGRHRSPARSAPGGSSRPRRRSASIRRRPRPASQGPLVSGLLVGYVRGVPLAESPLLHDLAAPGPAPPPLRTGGGVSPIPVLAGALCLAALFVYGAARELRGQAGGAVHGRLA